MRFIGDVHGKWNRYKTIIKGVPASRQVGDFGVGFLQWSGRRKLDMPSRTRQALQCMFEVHQPEVWLFGHWHKDIDHVHKGTRFICLNELSYIDLAF